MKKHLGANIHNRPNESVRLILELAATFGLNFWTVGVISAFV